MHAHACVLLKALQNPICILNTFMYQQGKYIFCISHFSPFSLCARSEAGGLRVTHERNTVIASLQQQAHVVEVMGERKTGDEMI